MNKYLVCLIISILCHANSLNAQFGFKGKIVDSKTGESLAFATLAQVNSNLGTISNADGYFAFKTDSCPFEIIISYIGYAEKQILLDCEESGNEIQISLDPVVFDLQDINIYHEDFIISQLKKIKRQNYKYLNKPKTGKAFFRYYTFANQQPIEFYEGFYNIKTSVDGILNIDFKSGRHRSTNIKPFNTYFATTNLSPLLDYFRLFSHDEKISTFPDIPVQINSKSKIKEQFELSFATGRLPHGVSKVIGFTSKTENTLSGNIYADSLNNLLKVVCTNTFRSDETKPIVVQSNGKIIGDMILSYEFVFDMVEGSNVLSHALIDYSYKFVTEGNDTLSIRTSVLNSNFDYDQTFILPVIPDSYQEVMNDMLIGSISPFFEEIYQNENVVLRSGKEDKLHQHFILNSEGNLKVWQPMMKIEPWSPDCQIDTNRLRLIRKIPVTNQFNEPIISHPVYRKYYIQTFDFYDYVCYDNRLRFTSESLIDYFNSYTTENIKDTVILEILSNYLHLAKINSLRIENELTNSYRTHCPSELEIERIIHYYSKQYNEEKDFYNDRVYYLGKDALNGFENKEKLDFRKQALDLRNKILNPTSK